MTSSPEDCVPFLKDLEDEAVEKDGTLENENDPRRRQRIRELHWPTLACCAFLLIVSNMSTLYLVDRSWSNNLDGTCNTYTSQSWNPILADVDVTYTSTSFNGSFYKESIYRQKPSPAVDAAWSALGTDYRPVIVPVEEAEISDIPLNRMMVDEQYGGPGYPAYVEVLHQLHCLNLLRQSLYFNSDYYHALGHGAFKNDEDILQPHIGHCLDMLRQRLMCTADTGMMPFIWAGDPPHVFPDFFRDYKCRNFDDIRAWVEPRQAPWGDEEDLDVVPHEGARIFVEVP